MTFFFVFNFVLPYQPVLDSIQILLVILQLPSVISPRAIWTSRWLLSISVFVFPCHIPYWVTPIDKPHQSGIPVYAGGSLRALGSVIRLNLVRRVIPDFNRVFVTQHRKVCMAKPISESGVCVCVHIGMRTLIRRQKRVFLNASTADFDQDVINIAFGSAGRKKTRLNLWQIARRIIRESKRQGIKSRVGWFSHLPRHGIGQNAIPDESPQEQQRGKGPRKKAVDAPATPDMRKQALKKAAYFVPNPHQLLSRCAFVVIPQSHFCNLHKFILRPTLSACFRCNPNFTLLVSLCGIEI